MTTLMIVVLIPLLGLAFILLVGRRRTTSNGAVDAPAPASSESPLFGEPDKTHTKH